VLPCGSTISVQPADFEWKEKKKRKKEMEKFAESSKGNFEMMEKLLYGKHQPHQVGEAEHADTETPQKGSHNTEVQNDEDLDDFFASLED